jgi:hypothetical protein
MCEQNKNRKIRNTPACNSLSLDIEGEHSGLFMDGITLTLLLYSWKRRLNWLLDSWRIPLSISFD